MAQGTRRTMTNAARTPCMLIPYNREYSTFEFQRSPPDRVQMSEWTQTDRRIGIWSATSAATIGVIYVVVGLIGIAARPPSRLALSQVDPYLAILEVLIILSA